MSDNANEIVAVYGTLRYGDRANHLMDGCKYLGQDTIKGKLYDLGAYPGAKFSNVSDDSTIVVDLYSFPNPGILKGLDRYEGYFIDDPDSSLYERKQTTTNEGVATVWVYEYLGAVDEDWRIESGDWFLDDDDNNNDGE